MCCVFLPTFVSVSVKIQHQLLVLLLKVENILKMVADSFVNSFFWQVLKLERESHKRELLEKQSVMFFVDLRRVLNPHVVLSASHSYIKKFVSCEKKKSQLKFICDEFGHVGSFNLFLFLLIWKYYWEIWQNSERFIIRILQFARYRWTKCVFWV